MATRLREYIAKASFTTSDLTGANNGGMLSTEQAKTFLKDAIEATVVVRDADVFDSASPTFEIPKIDFATRIMRAGTEGARLVDGDRTKPNTDLVSLSTKLFKGEVPVSDETFEDNVEQAGLADSLMGMIAAAVGRDLESIALKAKTGDPDATFALLGNGIVQELEASATSNRHDSTGVTSYKALWSAMIAKLPARYRERWDQLRFYVSPTKADGYAEELGDRGTALGDSNVAEKPPLRYRSIPFFEVPLLTGTQDSVNYDNFAILCEPKNLAVGFHRRVRVEKFRDPREGLTSFLPNVRMDVAWKQHEAIVIARNVPSL